MPVAGLALREAGGSMMVTSVAASTSRKPGVAKRGIEAIARIQPVLAKALESRVPGNGMATIPIAKIKAEDRMRGLSEAQVQTLILSVAGIGLLNPVTVYRRTTVLSGVAEEAFGLIAGAHRLEACRRLGWKTIPANVVELKHLEREIAQCDENLCGTRLTPSERAMFTWRRKLAYEGLHPETRNGGDRRSKKAVSDSQVEKLKSFAADTADKTGQSKQTVSRDAQRGMKISQRVLEAVRGTHLDTGVYLDSLKGKPEELQLLLIKENLARDRKKHHSPKATQPAPAEPVEDLSDIEITPAEMDRLVDPLVGVLTGSFFTGLGMPGHPDFPAVARAIGRGGHRRAKGVRAAIDQAIAFLTAIRTQLDREGA
jgi:ParB family transcriptional regulator, chromosome partitioning protein